MWCTVMKISFWRQFGKTEHESRVHAGLSPRVQTDHPLQKEHASNEDAVGVRTNVYACIICVCMCTLMCMYVLFVCVYV